MPGTQQSTAPAAFFRRFRSFFPDPLIPRTGTERRRFLARNLIFHFRPATVPEKTLAFSLTWGLGGMAAVLVLCQIGTGVLLKFVYEPTPVGAYLSVQSLIDQVPFGRLIRNLHHWCAHLLVLIVGLHMLRVFFSGAFHPPRQFNWVIGLMLFGTVLVANLTGYLLPWDQLAYWAVTISTGMLEYVPWIGVSLQQMIRGGTDIGPQTLRIFFAIHTALVPSLLIPLMAFHFWRIRRSGGLVIPRSPGEIPDEKPNRVPTLPHLLVREGVTALVLIAAVVLLAAGLDAPLAGPATPGLSPNPVKAPWYFAGLQELLLQLPPLLAVFLVPVTGVLALLVIPYAGYPHPTDGIWFASPAGRRLAIAAAATAAGVTPLLVVLGEWVAVGRRQAGGIPGIFSGALVPAAFAAVPILFLLFVKWRFPIRRNESVQTVFILLATMYVVLTIVGVWFRGQGMQLVWPWH